MLKMRMDKDKLTWDEVVMVLSMQLKKPHSWLNTSTLLLYHDTCLQVVNVMSLYQTTTLRELKFIPLCDKGRRLEIYGML